MKYKGIYATLLIGAFFSFTSVSAQSEMDSTGLPGDNFNLQGALDLFKKAKSPEEFEKMLNKESNKVNNLDLNNDGIVDYIRVIDRKDGNAHAIVLQVPISENESQDVAVIELEKTGPEEAIVQIVGDEALYGEKTIVEPQAPEAASNFTEDESFAGGPSAVVPNAGSTFITINCWDWPFVQFIFSPAYVVWISPWDWYHRPIWYRPFSPLEWEFFYSSPMYYNYNYVFVNTQRSIRCQQVYRPIRRTSPYVINRNRAVVSRYRNNRSTVYNRNNNGYNGGRYNRGEVRGYNNRRYNNGDNNRVYRDRNYNNNNRVSPERNYDNNRNYNPNRNNNRVSPERNYDPSRRGNIQRNERSIQTERNNNYNRGDVQFRNRNLDMRERSERRAEPRERRVERRDDSGQQGNRSSRGGRPGR